METEETTSVKLKRAAGPAVMGIILGAMAGALIGYAVLNITGSQKNFTKIMFASTVLGGSWGFYMGYTDKF